MVPLNPKVPPVPVTMSMPASLPLSVVDPSKSVGPVGVSNCRPVPLVALSGRPGTSPLPVLCPPRHSTSGALFPWMMLPLSVADTVPPLMLTVAPDALLKATPVASVPATLVNEMPLVPPVVVMPVKPGNVPLFATVTLLMTSPAPLVLMVKSRTLSVPAAPPVIAVVELPTVKPASVLLAPSVIAAAVLVMLTVPPPLAG